MKVQLTSKSEHLLREYLTRQLEQSPEEVIKRALQILAEYDATPEARTSILELQGLGKEIWQGIDAQEYVNRERASWNG